MMRWLNSFTARDAATTCKFRWTGRARRCTTPQGKGSFEGAVRGIRTLQRHTVPVEVRLTVHRYNVDQLEHAAHFLLEELGLRSFSTNAAGYLGSCRQNAERRAT